MPTLTRGPSIAYLLLILVSPHLHAQAVEPPPQSSGEQLEREIYRLQRISTAGQQSYADYLDHYYRQQSDVGDLAVQALRWQLFASNIILFLVVVLTSSGIVLSAYQLWIAARLALDTRNFKGGKDRRISAEPELTSASTLEISAGKVRVETAFVGILVLLISAALLVLYVREVYKVNVIVPRASSQEVRPGAARLPATPDGSVNSETSPVTPKERNQ